MLGSKESPRCLHHWRPHDGRPVSSLFFLDNHRNYNPDVQFWKFAVTGADHNSVSHTYPVSEPRSNVFMAVNLQRP